ncbi:response regulator transcription factor [Psychrobacillus psychrodurans]|jgi:two-component system response regulator ArlR|uniref:Response regulator transcription factor n=1 Tax=Psychrobacillus psychrodurans TaxID=126157 RepID=A0A9X3R8F8_9BACI|nr:response regulator transcription factor [Psychrobacillus psychrodurans]MCK1998819.1 response regulator transcription factor [Psychrobacillus psychrodurans]MCZ8532485.1 response regulator transcription factor [Psychrobacillus psychrodurans]MCZ8539926.1 response regulator transcription factor [Psychrobacillus psychrodurans]SFM54104.1 two-component system, OmpR family, response regulator ArlR [Psychrobacillus psychrodurans]
MTQHILLIEDEVNIAKFVELELKHENFLVTVSNDGREGADLALNHDYDLMLIDVMLPNLNGLEICRRVRKKKSTPIILITARDAIIDRVSGLETGADDYVVKPFAIEELLARIRAVLRRVEPSAVDGKSELTIQGLTIEQKAHQVFYDGKEIELTKTEYDMLVYLMENYNMVLSRDAILEKVWGYDVEVETNVVDVYIRHLRKKLPAEIAAIIETVRGVGYVMR